MRYILVCCFLMAFNLLFSQDYDLPDMGSYNLDTYYWKDTITANQIKKWDNGKIKIEYINLNDSIKLRKEYSINGELKQTVEVMQSFFSDTSISFNPEIFNETFTITQGVKDIFHGRYIQYHTGTIMRPHIRGQYRNGYTYGEWQKIEYSSKLLKTANYNTKGQLEGLYTEYHTSSESIKQQVKLQGEYKVLKMEEWYVDGKSKKKKIYEHYYSRRIGVWKLYNEVGELIETVGYKPIQR